MIVGLLLWACGSGTPTATPEPAADCALEPFAELQIPCWIGEAEQAAARADPAAADRACSELPQGRWAEECAFRVGEELARSGKVVEGVAFCGRAARYARFCLTHAAWRLRPQPGWVPSDPAAGGLPAELIAAAAPGLAGLPPVQRAEGLAALRAGLWHRLYYGQGRADPAAALAAGSEDGPAARSAFALEAVRLLAPWDQPLPDDLVARVARAFTGEDPVPVGETLPLDRRVGRYSVGAPPLELSEWDTVPTFGGGTRLVAPVPLDDLAVATTEALFFRETTPAEAFYPLLEDPRGPVRWTAAWRATGLLKPVAERPVPFAEHEDPLVRVLAHPPSVPPERTATPPAEHEVE